MLTTQLVRRPRWPFRTLRSLASRDGADRGSTSIELAGTLPLLLLVILFLGHAVGVVAGVDATTQAARQAARAASQAQSAPAAAADAVPDWMRLDRVTTGPCSDACVRVTASVPVGLPGIVTVSYLPITREATFARHD